MLNNIKIASRDTFIYSLGNISTKIIGIVLLPLYTERLTVAEYGILGTVEITIQILIAGFSLSLFRALSRWYWDRNYRHRQGSIFFTTLISLGIFSVLLIIIFLPFTKSLSVVLLDSSQYTYLFILLLFSSAMQIMAKGTLTLMRLQQKPSRFTITNIFKLIITLGLTLYFIIGLGRGVAGIIEAQIIGFLAFLLINLKYILRNSVPTFERRIFIEMVKYSYPLALSSIISVLLTVADRYTVRYVSGMESMGLYSLGFKVANVLKVFIINSLNSALMPLKFKMMDQSNNRRFYSKIMTYTTFGFIIFLLILSLFSKEVLKILAQDPQYWNAYKIVPILCFAQLFELLRGNANFGLIIEKKTQIISAILVFVSIAAIGLNILLVSNFGNYGAATATLLAQMIFFGLMYHFAQRHYKIPYELGKIIMMILIAIIIVFVSFMVVNPLQLLPRLLIKMGLVLLFPVVLYFLGFYEDIEIDRLKSAWLKWKNPRKWRANIRNIHIK